MATENHLGSESSKLSEAEEMSYAEGYVLCCECRNLESFWKDGEFAFFMCRLNAVSMKTLEIQWRKCERFEHTNEPPTKRRNEIQ
jgi:hypothetical protein